MGERFADVNFVDRVAYGGGGVMVWARRRGVDYAGDVSPSLLKKSKFVPRTFLLDSCVRDMIRF